MKRLEMIYIFIFIYFLLLVFPFYTIGRFPNDVCTGSNKMLGTCVIRGECKDGGGVSTGSCSALSVEPQHHLIIHIFIIVVTQVLSLVDRGMFHVRYKNIFTCGPDICQLRIDFLSLSLAPPNGNGECLTDFLSVVGGSSRVPKICGENSGQHVYIDFNAQSPIVIAIDTTSSFTFNRYWQIQVSQIGCSSEFKAPSGCLQYLLDETGLVMTFNYAASPNALPNSIGVDGTRQLANQRYGICVRMAANKCGITWSQIASDMYSFTVTGDVGAVDPSLLGTIDVQSQDCTTDFIIIPNPNQNNAPLPSDRFCGLGLVTTTSFTKPFVLYVVHDNNENYDIANRGFSLSYSQIMCPIV